VSEKIWEQTTPDEHGHHWHGAGDWAVRREDGGTISVEMDDCGCCGPHEVIQATTVAEFDAEWERIGAMLREQVRRGLEK